MERNNFYPRVVLLAAVFLFSFSMLCAQEAGYFIDDRGSEPRIFQRLVWDREEYALYYEVLIYVDDGGYEEHLRTRTERNYIEVYLPPGIYSYNVTPYDLLGRRGDTSEWKTIEVFPAYFPKIERFSPSVFFLDQKLDRVLNITGVNLREESEIYLAKDDASIYPVEVEITGDKTARLVFSDQELIPGEYDIYIKNPGGLETRAGGFIINYRNPLYVFVKASLYPAIPVYGGMNEIFGTNLFPVGINLSFELISTKRSTFNGGLELSASAHFLNSAIIFQSGSNDSFAGFEDAETGAVFFDIDLNIALQKRIVSGKFAFTTRFGFGITLFGGNEEFLGNGMTVHFNLGVTGLFLVYRNFYLEAGLDYSHYNSYNAFGLLKPRLGLVWQF